MTKYLIKAYSVRKILFQVRVSEGSVHFVWLYWFCAHSKGDITAMGPLSRSCSSYSRQKAEKETLCVCVCVCMVCGVCVVWTGTHVPQHECRTEGNLKHGPAFYFIWDRVSLLFFPCVPGQLAHDSHQLSHLCFHLPPRSAGKASTRHWYCSIWLSCGF